MNTTVDVADRTGPEEPRLEATRVSERQRDLLDNAVREADRRGLYDVPVVDVDSHLMEIARFDELAHYVRHPVIRRELESYHGIGAARLMPRGYGDRELGGRIFRDPHVVRCSGEKDLEYMLADLDRLAIDYSLLFPTAMLALGTHPNPEFEVAIAQAYNRWLLDELKACGTDRLRAMLYLPFNDPAAALKEVEELSGEPGVAAFMVTSVRDVPVHHDSYLPIYELLEAQGIPLAFHTGTNAGAGIMRQLNRFISVHTLDFPLYNMVHMLNLVINGIVTRFPNLKIVYLEAGVFWLPFIIQRLDHEFMMRPSEAPQLEARPSEYIRSMYFSTQPMEMPEQMRHLEMVFEMINGESQLLFSSDWPHWDFDLPGKIWDLPFLSDDGRRNILGANAAHVFNLPQEVRAERPVIGASNA